MIGSPILRQAGARLALAALLVQFVLSFGHLHATDVWGPLGFKIGHDFGQAGISGHRASDETSGSRDADLAEDGCSICASIVALGSAVLPDPVRPRPPQPANGGIAAGPSRPSLAAIPGLPFQARAPPTT